MTTTIKLGKSTQSAIPEMNRPEKTIYYLVIGEGEEAVTMNIGEICVPHGTQI